MFSGILIPDLGIWDRLFRRGMSVRAADSGKPLSELIGTGTGAIYEEDSTAYACITTIAESCAALPFRAIRINDGLPVDPGVDTSAASFNRMMARRIDGLTAFAFWTQVFVDMAKHGNAFLSPITMNDILIDLARIDPSTVEVRRDESRRIVYEIGGTRDRDILHIRLPILDSDTTMKGTPPMRTRSRAARLASGGNEFVLKRLTEGIPPTDILLSDEPFTVAEVESLRDVDTSSPRFAARYGGGIRDVKSYGRPPQDADTRELREQSVLEIARRFGVPAPIIGLNITQWGSGVEALARMFYRFTLRGYLTNVEAAVSTLFGPRFEARFDVTPLLVPDADTKAKVSNALTGAGAATMNEIRKMWDLPPLDGGDDLISATQESQPAEEEADDLSDEEIEAAIGAGI